KLYDPSRLDVEWREYWRTFRYDINFIPPVLEPPKTIAPSYFQPLVRGFRQFNRSHMRARPRFLERFVLVGHLVKQVDGRKKMAGVPTRQAGGGYTYVYPEFVTGN